MYSLTSSKGNLRLYTNPNVIKERESTSLIGFRQTESDFEYGAKMYFNPKTDRSEAGISLFQKDDNYFTFTVVKVKNDFVIQLKLAEPNSEAQLLKELVILDYDKEITFKVKSENHNYSFYYSINGIEFNLFVKTKANHILSKGYTGAYLGVYATSNGKTTEDYADFDWVNYKGFEKI
jgi:alpha-N-arabinofuranosidase